MIALARKTESLGYKAFVLANEWPRSAAELGGPEPSAAVPRGGRLREGTYRPHGHSGPKRLPGKKTPSLAGARADRPWVALESKKVNRGKWWVSVFNQLQIIFSLVLVAFL